MEKRDSRPILLFFSSRKSGPARRMASLVSWISVTRKELRVVEVDIDHHDRLAQALDVRDAPSLLLLQGGGTVDRLEGRATGTQIAGFLKRHLRAPLAT